MDREPYPSLNKSIAPCTSKTGAEFMEILDFNLNRKSSFSSLRGSKVMLLGVPERFFYEVLRFLQKKFFLIIRLFFFS